LTRILKAIWFWTYFLPLTAATFSVIAIGRVFLVLRGKRVDFWVHNCSTVWARLTFHLMPGWKIEIIGKENVPKLNEPTVMVANHSSAVDMWSLYFLDTQFRWLSKEIIFKTPLIGRAMRWGGYIPVVRGDKGSHRNAMAQSAARIRGKVNMLFFPEGTRSTTGELLPFKLGAFKLAAQENVPIVPIALGGAKDLAKKGSALPGKATIRVKVMPAQRPKPGETPHDFAVRIREQISKALAEIA
jgi:1-acyl-sn-glycerol-3-phosphate acyltransferase